MIKSRSLSLPPASGMSLLCGRFISSAWRIERAFTWLLYFIVTVSFTLSCFLFHSSFCTLLGSPWQQVQRCVISLIRSVYDWSVSCPVEMEMCLPESVFISGTCTDVNVFTLKIHLFFFFGLWWLSFNVRHIFPFCCYLTSTRPHVITLHVCFVLFLPLHVFRCTCMILTTLTVACLLFFFRRGREECV